MGPSICSAEFLSLFISSVNNQGTGRVVWCFHNSCCLCQGLIGCRDNEGRNEGPTIGAEQRVRLWDLHACIAHSSHGAHGAHGTHSYVGRAGPSGSAGFAPPSIASLFCYSQPPRDPIKDPKGPTLPFLSLGGFKGGPKPPYSPFPEPHIQEQVQG